MYYPEGTYFLHREMFDREIEGATFNNFTKIGASAVVSNDAATGLNILDDPERLYALNPGAAAGTQLVHNARYQQYLREFRTEFAAVVGLFEHNDAPGALDYITYCINDPAANNLITVIIYGDGHIDISDTVNITTSAVGLVPVGQLLEIKVELSGPNDTFRGDRAFRVYIDGTEIRHDGAGACGCYDGGIYTETWERNAATGLPDYYFVVLQNVGDIYEVFSYSHWKLHADMTDFANIPFKEVMVLANDLCSFLPLGDNTQSFTITESLNNVTGADIQVRSVDTIGLIANHIKDDPSDGLQANFALDSEIRIFTQVARIVQEGANATIVNVNFLTDASHNFINEGVRAGDWLYTWNANANHAVARQITVVTATTLSVSSPYITIGIGQQNYSVVRGHDRYWSRYLGDYIFIGQLKEYAPSYNHGESIIDLVCFDHGFHMTKKRVWCTTTKFYRKDFDRIFQGWPIEDLLVGYGTTGSATDIIINGGIYNSQLGLLNPSIYQPLYDSSLTELRALYSFVFRRNEFIFDALKKVIIDGALQYVCYYDRENANQRYLMFRNYKDKTIGQNTNVYAANMAATDIMEDNKLGLDLRIRKGRKQFVDYVEVNGALAGDNSGNVIAWATPTTIMPDRWTEEMFEADMYIWETAQAEYRSSAIYADLQRIVPQGTVKTEYFPPRDTWSIPASVTWADDGTPEYPGGPAISHVTTQTRWYNGSSNNASALGIFWANRHSQANEYRKPPSRIGETGALYLDPAWTESYVVYELVTEYSPRGFFSRLRPEVKPWDVIIDLADTRRDIDRIAQNFIDPDVSECPMLLPIEDTGIQDYIGVGLVPEDIAGYADSGGQQVQIRWVPFTYVDEDDSDTAYSYCLYYRAGGSGIGTPWIPLPLQTAGTNEITSIQDATSAIKLNNDPAADFGFLAPNNYANVQFPIGGTYDIMIELRIRVVTAAGTQDIQRAIPPLPPDTALPAGDELIETASVGGESNSQGLIALIDWSAVVVA